MFRESLSIISAAAFMVANKACGLWSRKHTQRVATISLCLVLALGSSGCAFDGPLVLAGHNPAESQIVIEAPMEYEEISGPVDIRIRFDQRNGVEIDLDTLEFRYGQIKVDITSHVMDHAKIIKNRLLVMGATMPPGKHNILVRVWDNNGVRHERWFRLSVKRRSESS